MRRGITIGLASLLVVLVVVVVVVSKVGGGGGGKTVTVRGVIGSEKQPFFDDPRVKQAFHKAGFDVQVDTAGSRQIATSVDLSKYDFAFPAGTPQAAKIKADHNARAVYVPFSTPLAIATFEPIAELLKGAGVAQDHGGWWSFDMAKFLTLVDNDRRWNTLTDVDGNATYNANKQVLITSTDVTTSNSAEMYASVAAYVRNHSNVVASQAEADATAKGVAPLFSRQGYTEQSSEAPFQDYLTIGAGKTPMVWIYESQFVASALAKDGSIKPGMVLMYPNPTIVSKHTLVPLTDNGDKIGQLLTTDPTLQDLAVQYGFRTGKPGAFDQAVKAAGVTTAPDLVNVIEPPTYENLEALINAISTEMAATGSTTASPSTTTH
jgi:hypothetical protein